jgi:hypothetical protein
VGDLLKNERSTLGFQHSPVGEILLKAKSRTLYCHIITIMQQAFGATFEEVRGADEQEEAALLVRIRAQEAEAEAVLAAEQEQEIAAQEALVLVEGCSSTNSPFRVIFHRPLAGFYVISKGLGTNERGQPKDTFYFHNIDTNELALQVEFTGSNDGKHILVDRCATKLVIHALRGSWGCFEVWSLVEQTFQRAIMAPSPVVSFLSDDGTKLFYDDNTGARKTINMADTDTRATLWSQEVEFNGQYLTKGHSVTACFTANNEHLVVLLTDYVTGERNRYLDRVTLRFHDTLGGAVSKTTVIVPFSGDTVQSGICDTAVIISGAQFKQLGVVLIGADLTSSRIVLIPTGIIPVQTNLGSRYIRFGPSNTLIVSLNDEPAATVVSYDCRLIDATIAGDDAGVRKICDVVLPKPFRFFDKYAVHSATNRLAIGFSETGYEWGQLKKIHCYDIETGASLNVFESQEVVVAVRAMEDGMVVLL